MLVLGIETTCDETSAAIVRKRPEGGGEILANEVLSQIAEHAAYGGVVPEIAARAHVDYLDHLIRRALSRAGVALAQVDAVAAAAGPGLIGGLLVGLTTGKALAWAAGKPFVAVNHLEAHALTARMTDNLPFPYIMLLMSGGHTQLLEVRGVGDYRRLGSTIDDAIGEAFDKVGKLLGLPYPGGPNLERAAENGDPARFELPRPMLGRTQPDFSLSGLKTAVRNEATKIAPLSKTDVADLCASFQSAIVDIVIDRARAALRVARETGSPPEALVVAGGVQNRSDNYRVSRLVHLVNDAIGKAVGVTPVDVFGRVTAAAEQWILRQFVPHADDLFYKLRSESGLAGFIPRGRFGHVHFNPRPKLDAPVHLP